MPFIVDWLEGHWRSLLEEIWRELTLGNQRRHQRRLRETSRETCHSYRIAWIVQTYKELHRFLLCTDHLYWARWASWVLNKPFISSWLVGIAFSKHLVFERYNIVHAVALVSELWKAHFRIKKMSNVDFFLFFKRYENARNNAGLQLLYLISKIKMERSKYIFMHSLYRNEILRVSEFLKDCWKCTEN